MEADLRRPSVGYVEREAKSALSRVTGMFFGWSLNPYIGCEHRCAFCYVRFFERRADRPSAGAYGRTVIVKVNIPALLLSDLRRRSWRRGELPIGTATDPS